jgi:hypothetical protein
VRLLDGYAWIVAQRKLRLLVSKKNIIIPLPTIMEEEKEKEPTIEWC